MTITISGIIKHIGELETFQSGFTKRQILIEEIADLYPQVYPVDLLKEKTDLLIDKAAGESISIECNLRGSEHNGKHYLNLTAWKIND